MFAQIALMLLTITACGTADTVGNTTASATPAPAAAPTPIPLWSDDLAIPFTGGAVQGCMSQGIPQSACNVYAVCAKQGLNKKYSEYEMNTDGVAIIGLESDLLRGCLQLAMKLP